MTIEQSTRLLALQSGATRDQADKLLPPCPQAAGCAEMEAGNSCEGCDVVTHGGYSAPLMD